MKLRIVILGGLLAFGQMYGQGNQAVLPTNQPSSANSQPANNQNPAGSFITVNASGNSFASNAVPQANSNNLDELRVQESMANATWWQVKIAFTLIIVAAAQFWIYRRQAKIMDKQAEISQSALEISQIQMRASIHIEIQDFRNQKDFNGNDITRIEVWFKNTGPTPAKKVRGWARFRRAPFPIPEGFVFPDEPTANHASVLTMGSDEIRKMDAYPPKEQAGYSGDTRFYVYGKITYWDVFEKGERHTNFCRFIEVDAKTGEFHVFSSNREQDNEAT